MITFTNTLNTLREWGDKIRQTYREKNIQAGYDPSRPLQNINFTVSSNGSTFEITFDVPSYWKYAENGRGPGKMPPPGVLLEWMKFKHILPSPMQYKTGPRAGKTYIPTMESLEFMIRRKIGGTLWPYGPSPDGKPPLPGKKGGTDGKHTWEETVEQLREGLTKAVEEALYRDIAEYVKMQSE